MATFAWTERKAAAAVLVAEDDLSNVEIAERVGVSRQGLDRWKRNPEFRARVDEHVGEIRKAILTQGIADRVQRVKAQNDRWRRLQRVLDARAERGKVEQGAPGDETGVLVKQHKMVGTGRDAELVTEYAADTGLLAEMRALEKQAAQEVGQWVEKVAPSKGDGSDLDLAGLILRVREMHGDRAS